MLHVRALPFRRLLSRSLIVFVALFLVVSLSLHHLSTRPRAPVGGIDWRANQAGTWETALRGAKVGSEAWLARYPAFEHGPTPRDVSSSLFPLSGLGRTLLWIGLARSAVSRQSGRPHRRYTKGDAQRRSSRLPERPDDERPRMQLQEDRLYSAGRRMARTRSYLGDQLRRRVRPSSLLCPMIEYESTSHSPLPPSAALHRFLDEQQQYVRIRSSPWHEREGRCSHRPRISGSATTSNHTGSSPSKQRNEATISPYTLGPPLWPLCSSAFFADQRNQVTSSFDDLYR